MFAERRISFRSQVIGTREGVLRVEKSELRVRLLDESASGLSVACDVMPTFPEQAVGELETDDGDIYRVLVIHVQPRGMCARIGLKRLETLQHAGKSMVTESPRGRRGKTLKTAAFVFAGLALGLCAQAEPVRKQLAIVPGLSKFFGDPGDHRPAGPVGPKMSQNLRQRLQENFEIDLFAEPEMSVLLHLRPEQQTRIRSVVDAKNAVVRSSAGRAQQAAVLYITQMAMLGVLDTDQKYRLESLLEHTIGATDLLQKLVTRYWPTADADELYKRLGAPALALPQVAEKLGLDEKQLRAVRAIVDDALNKSESLYRNGEKSAAGDEQFMVEAYGFLTDAQAKCLAVLNDAQRAKLELMKN